MAIKSWDDADRELAAEAEPHLVTCLTLSAALYAQWQADAAFYLLRAAEALAWSREQYARVLAVAIARRDEQGCTPASDAGVRTATTREAITRRGYRDSYESLAHDLTRWMQSPHGTDAPPTAKEVQS